MSSHTTFGPRTHTDLEDREYRYIELGPAPAVERCQVGTRLPILPKRAQAHQRLHVLFWSLGLATPVGTTAAHAINCCFNQISSGPLARAKVASFWRNGSLPFLLFSGFCGSSRLVIRIVLELQKITAKSARLETRPTRLEDAESQHARQRGRADVDVQLRGGQMQHNGTAGATEKTRRSYYTP